MSIEKNKFLIGRDDGDYLPLLDMVHKVTAEKSGGSLTIEELGIEGGTVVKETINRLAREVAGEQEILAYWFPPGIHEASAETNRRQQRLMRKETRR